MGGEPFVGSEALAAGGLTRYELRRHHRAVMPNVYTDKRIDPSLASRTAAAWLWSGRRGVIAGSAAAALHGAEWIDDTAPVELIWSNARPPDGVVTRCDLLLEGETQTIGGMTVTSVARTGFDLGRRDTLAHAVARLDGLARATQLTAADVAAVARRHRHTRGLRQLDTAIELMDPGAASPKETWLRLLLIRAGFPRPRTQIPVFTNGRQYYLDMGWEDMLLAAEYDGDQHRTDPVRYAYDIERSENLSRAGWTVVRVVARSREAEVVQRVRRAWDALILRPRR